MKKIKEQNEWGKVSSDLSNEEIKLQSYDYLLVDILGNVAGKKILDYGCGPGVLLNTLGRNKALVKGFDISEKMILGAEKYISRENLFSNFDNVTNLKFEIIICNLVLCIVDEKEVKNILINIYNLLVENGSVYIGFCNPKVYNIKESQLDFREETKYKYSENHTYTKIKKEGEYCIIEEHRPIEWYRNEYIQSGFNIKQEYFTEKYSCCGDEVEDFIIFELTK